MLRITGVVVLALVVGLVVFVQIQQRTLRWRAERLLADMRELQSHKGTWSDAQKIMAKWGAWGSYDGSCTAEQCTYSIIISDALNAFVWGHFDRYPFLRSLSRPCVFLGEKDAFVLVTLKIEGGIVTKSSYAMYVSDRSGNMLIGRANAVNDFEPYEHGAERMLHPEYWTGKNGACTVCVKFETGYSPLAGRNKIRELTDFNFSCITRLLSCTTEADIMPSLWKQYQEEQPGNVARMNALMECKVPLEFYGREDSNIDIADIISRHGPMASGGSTDWSARLRVIRSLKGEMPWPQDKILTASESDRGEEIHGWGSTDMLAGKRYIIFGEIQEDESDKKALVLDNCGVVPYNEQNLSAIQRGIDASLARHIPER
jgi:hypothetical protein